MPLLAAQFLMTRLGVLTGEVAALRDGQSRFSRRYAIATSNGERRRIILDYAGELGASARSMTPVG